MKETNHWHNGNCKENKLCLLKERFTAFSRLFDLLENRKIIFVHLLQLY